MNAQDMTIRYINEQYKLEEMAVRVGIVKPGNYLIFVNTDDPGKIPHFHVVDATSNGKDKKKGFSTCICIDKPEYFIYGNKTDKITNGGQRKALDTFLRQPFQYKKFNGTNWEYIVMIWNMNNSEVTIDEDVVQPDYTLLK